ncbi:hypothetical protein ACF0H5_009294 [Mactra antiquata]
MKWEKFLCPTVLALLAWTIHCYGQMRRFGLYEFGVCPTEGTKFKTLINRPIRDCVKECAIRPSSFKFDNCLKNGTVSSTYTGQVSSTVKGKTCQRWDQHNPHPHKYRDINMFPDDSFENLSNFCRDPDGIGHVWCYTLDPDDKWDWCGVTRCLQEFNPRECYGFDEVANDYKGTLNTTAKGYTCQNWDSQTPQRHVYNETWMFPDENVSEARNYCRDPDKSGVPWCYTTDQFILFGMCDVARCHDRKCKYLISFFQVLAYLKYRL